MKGQAYEDDQVANKNKAALNSASESASEGIDSAGVGKRVKTFSTTAANSTNNQGHKKKMNLSTTQNAVSVAEKKMLKNDQGTTEKVLKLQRSNLASLRRCFGCWTLLY